MTTPRSTRAYADHFSSHASLYARTRPRYPLALFHWLATVAPGTALAWDAGTGNGQAATGLVTRFAHVLATDASAPQLANAEAHARITYRVAQYESGLPDGAAQLVTVGQALHWFDVPAFLREARRVLQPGGVLAVFGYQHSAVTPEVDLVVRHHHDVTLGHYWPPERRLVVEGYRSIALPIDELPPPPLEMQEDWTLAQFGAYVRSWSAAQRCIAARGEEPILAFERALAEAWGTAPRRSVRWPLMVRAGEIR